MHCTWQSYFNTTAPRLVPLQCNSWNSWDRVIGFERATSMISCELHTDEAIKSLCFKENYLARSFPVRLEFLIVNQAYALFPRECCLQPHVQPTPLPPLPRHTHTHRYAGCGNGLDHFAKQASVRSEITELGDFGPDRSRTGPKPIWQSGLIRSHKIVIDGRHNQPTEAWLYLASVTVPPCGLPAVPWLDISPPLSPAPWRFRGEQSSNGCVPSFIIRPLWGFAVSRVRTDDLTILRERIRPLCPIGFGPVRNYLARYIYDCRTTTTTTPPSPPYTLT